MSLVPIYGTGGNVGITSHKGIIPASFISEATSSVYRP